MEKVALDATLWDEPTTGIGLYTRELYDALVRLGADVERVGARTSGELPRDRDSRTAWILADLPKVLAQSEARIFHAVSNFNLPLTRVSDKRYVLTVHDLIPELLPDTVSRAFRWQFRLWLSRSLMLADQVICVSETTRTDLLRRYDVDASRVSVVHNGVDHLSRLPDLDDTAHKYLSALALPDEYVLYAGSLDARKNVALALDALVELHGRGRRPTLVLAGQAWFGSGSVESRIGELRASGMDIRPLGYLSPACFYAVMQRASVFVFPSKYEGFGLPPLEAMWLGVPTIVSNAGALPEVCGDGALSVSPEDAHGLADAIDRLLQSPDERKRLGDKGRRQAQTFTWERAAQKTLAVYERALGVR